MLWVSSRKQSNRNILLYYNNNYFFLSVWPSADQNWSSVQGCNNKPITNLMGSESEYGANVKWCGRRKAGKTLSQSTTPITNLTWTDPRNVQCGADIWPPQIRSMVCVIYKLAFPKDNTRCYYVLQRHTILVSILWNLIWQKVLL
jgi:hypothetical protein